MELLLKISLLLLSLLHLAATDTTLRDAKCTKTNDMQPVEWYSVQSNPSALHDLTVKFNHLSGSSASSSLNISWAINIDSSIHKITGTWIELDKESPTESHKEKYRCDYQPPFSSDPDNYAGLEQLWFSFTKSDVHIEPNDVYRVTVYNLPTPSVNLPETPLKIKEVHVPGCKDEQMKIHASCLKQKTLDFTAVPEGDEIVVTFKSLLDTSTYDIILLRDVNKLIRTKKITDGSVKNVTVRLMYSGPCEKLKISITPHFKSCGRGCAAFNREVDCKKPDPEPLKEHNTSLIATGCIIAIAVLLLFICICQYCRLRVTSASAGPVRVLIVYPAVDSVFQHAVMALADFLQKSEDLKVIIDMWQRGSLAEQGPLRWLNSQADQADQVLIILPIQPTHTTINIETAQKPDVTLDVSDYTVPASAHELYSLALNLVASSACDRQRHQKFWVVHLSQDGETSKVPVELRGCKALSLPRDLEKLQQKLASRQGLSRRTRPFHCSEASSKVREAMLKLDENHLNCLKEELVHLTKTEGSLEDTIHFLSGSIK